MSTGPQGSTNLNLVVPMNPGSPSTSDSGYYIDIIANHGLFTSDQTPLSNPAATNQVNQNARNPLYGRPNLLLNGLRWVSLVS